jgi:hypothetical protein
MPKKRGLRLSKARLDALIEEATLDAYGDDEQRAGFFTMIEDNLKLPFQTAVLGMPVRVESVEQENDEILAVCVRGRERQALPIMRLPLPSPPPKGAEWIEAYRHWAQGG